jgi:hypothetical protein
VVDTDRSAIGLEGLQLDAAFEAIPLFEVGARAVFRIRIANGGRDLEEEIRMRVCAPPALLLVSTAPWLHGPSSGCELNFAMPGLLSAETREIGLEAYALIAGESRIDVRMECGGMLREAVAVCVAEGRASFEHGANRIDLGACEAEAGARVEGRIVLTNTGRAAATIAELRLEGDLDDAAAECCASLLLEPGERRTLRIGGLVPRDAADGATLTVRAAFVACSGSGERAEIALGDARIVARSRARFEGTIEPIAAQPMRVRAGDRIEWRVRIANVGGARAERATVALHPGGGVYVPGSTRIEDARIIDVGGTSALWSADGLRVEDVGAGQTITLECATLAEPGAGDARLWARLVYDGAETLLESRGFAVEAADGAARLPFVVRDAVLRAHDPQPSAPGLQLPRRYRRSPRAALDPAAARHLRGLGGLMRHLWALAALCADESDDTMTSGHVASVRTALRSVFDRLAIKLRMPHYPVRADDVLDPTAADALAALAPAGPSLGSRLARATSLLSPEREDYAELQAYREALRVRLEAIDDAAVIDALVVTQPKLDERLDAVLAVEARR